MKKILKKILLPLLIIGAIFSTTTLLHPQSVYADGEETPDCRYFLGMVSWDCNTGLNDNPQNEEAISQGIWVAVSNVVTDITIIATYLVIGYVIYGGYLYTFSGGDAGKVATGKKTIAQGLIGLGVVMLASVIVNSIRIALGSNISFSQNCVTANGCGVDPGTMVTNLIHWVTGVAGFVSAIFVVYGGISYITSSGDPGKVQKAKSMITYALIGLVIVALAEIITAFVSSTIRNSTNETSYINYSNIKELK